MNIKILALAAAVSFSMTVATQAETKVTLKGVHLCCGQCVKIAGTAVGKVEGAKAECDQDAGTITVTAPDDKTAQKALDALAGEGFYGKSDNDKVLIKPAAAGKDKVKRLVISGVHNCCPQCCKAIKAVVTKVEGVSGTDVKPKGPSFTVEGDFAPADVVKALNDAGFNATLEKKK
jgi:copper chaperone CopZ